MRAVIMVCIALLAMASNDSVASMQTNTVGPAVLHVRVVDAQGKAVAQAVASLRPMDQGSIPALPAHTTAMMDQKQMAFVPQVLVVRVGTQVVFPNSDQIHHDIYSFSSAKTFDINLRPGTRTAPLTFGKPGVVVLGCNIHDWMLGFIDVVDTPYFAKSGADGTVVLRHVPAGRYQLRIWQPRLNGPVRSMPLTLKPGEKAHRSFQLSLHPPERSNTAPAYLRNEMKPH